MRYPAEEVFEILVVLYQWESACFSPSSIFFSLSAAMQYTETRLRIPHAIPEISHGKLRERLGLRRPVIMTPANRRPENSPKIMDSFGIHPNFTNENPPPKAIPPPNISVMSFPEGRMQEITIPRVKLERMTNKLEKKF